MTKQLLPALCILAFIGLSACATTATDLPEPTQAIAPTEERAQGPAFADVTYVDDGDPMHTLDIYLPEGIASAIPTLLFFHGDGDTKEDHQGFASSLAERGYAVVVSEYRSPNEPGNPLMLKDASCALAWVHANADNYGFDPNRIVAFGFSLGGMIAADLGAVDDMSVWMSECPHEPPESSPVTGVVTYAAVLGTPEVCLAESWCMSGAAAGNQIPITEMLAIFEGLRDLEPSEWSEDSRLGEETAAFAGTLPLYWVDGSEPDYLIIHGSDDDRVPPGESQAFVERLQADGVSAELQLVEGAGHQSIYPASSKFGEIVEAVAAFLASTN